MAMSQEYRRTLDRALPKLCEDLDVDPIIPHLIAKGLFNESDREKLDAEAVRSKRVSQFVSILKRRGQEAFVVLVTVLRDDEGSKHLATHLEEVYDQMRPRGEPVIAHPEPVIAHPVEEMQ